LRPYTTDDLSSGTIDLVEESGFLVEIKSGSLRLTGKNPNEDTWNNVLTHQQQSVSSGDQAEAVSDPGTLQWAGKITAEVYVAMPHVHGNLRLFGVMKLQFRIMDDGPDIQFITAELEMSYPVLRRDLPFWLRSRFQEHDACGAPEVDESKEDMRTKLQKGGALDVKKPADGDKPLTLFDSSRFKDRVQSSWSEEAHDEPLMAVAGSLTLTYPCAEAMKGKADLKCKKWETDKKASECQDDDLMTGIGNATLLWNKVAMNAATGPMAVECGAGAKLYSTLTTLGSMKIGNVAMEPAEIKLYLQETDVNGTRAAGMVAGKVDANGKTGVAYFMFNDCPDDDWDATAGRIRPAIRKVLDKDPLYIMFEAESKHPCPEEGTELEGEVRWTSRKYQKPGTKHDSNREDFNLVDEVHGESGKGMMYCADPGNTTLLRYEMTTKIRRKVFIAGGQLKLLHSTLSVKGYGAQDAPLAGMLWDLELSGECESASQGYAFGIFAPGTAVVSATRSPATQDFTRPELLVNVNLNGWIGTRDESGAIMIDLDQMSSDQEYNEAVDGNHAKLFDFSAVGRCRLTLSDPR